MIRNSFAPVVLLLAASLLYAQSPPGSTTGKATTAPAPGTTDTAGSMGEGTTTGIGKGSGQGTKKTETGTTSSTTGSGTSTSSGSSPKKPNPGSLEDLIDKALKNNADIRAAEAKVREAEAELNRVRHQIVAKVATLKHDITTAKKMLEFTDKQAGLVAESIRRGAGSQQELQAALAAVEKQKADLARLETEMQSLTGGWKNVIGSVAFSPDGGRIVFGGEDGSVRIWDVRTGMHLNDVTGRVTWTVDSSASVQTPMAERIKAALNKSVKIDASKGELPLTEVLAYLVQKAGIDVPFRLIGKLDDVPVSLMKGDLPLGAWLQVFEDSGDVRFVIREYGILVTATSRVPKGAISVQDFWKQKTKSESPMGGSSKLP
jgi:hypothetical protein